MTVHRTLWVEEPSWHEPVHLKAQKISTLYASRAFLSGRKGWQWPKHPAEHGHRHAAA